MKLYFFFILLLVPSSLIGQIDLPEKVTIKLYSGGDYRNLKLQKGAHELIDSVDYKLIKEYKCYHSDRIFFQNNTFIRDEETFESKNINQDSTMVSITDSTFDQEIIAEILKWSEKRNYHEVKYRDTILDEFINEKTLLIANELSIDDFGIDSLKLELECLYHQEHIDKDIDCKQISLSKILEFFVNKNWGQKVISSYFEYIELKLFFKDKETSIFQSYPGEYNIKWFVTKDTKNKQQIDLINPKLNKLIFESG